MTDDADMYRRFRTWASWALEEDLRKWALERMDEAVSRVQRRQARDRLLREAGEMIGGTRYRQATVLLRLQLWVLTPGQSRVVVPDSIEEKVALALATWPKAAKLGRLKKILKDGHSRA